MCILSRQHAGDAKKDGRGRRYFYYRCTRNHRQGNTGCQGQMWNANTLETYVIDYLKGLSNNGDFLFDTKSHLQEIRDLLNVHEIEPELDRLDKGIQKNKTRISTLLDKLQDNLMSDEDFKARYDDLTQEIENMETTKTRLQEEHARSHEHLH